MNENKLYFSISREGGEIRISYDAVAMLARDACLETSGVTGMSTADASGEWSGQKGIIVEKCEGEGSCRVALYITVLFGETITDIARAVQANVKSALESSLSLNAEAVDVFVSGITFAR